MRCCSYVNRVTSAIAIAICIFAGAVFPQNNQNIIFQYCTIHPQDKCFDPVEGAVDTVGRDVSELGGDYRFCLKIDTIDAGFAPVRVILVLDNSLSMCQNPGGRTGCCVVGDSSGECMNNDPDDKRIEAARIFVDSLRALNQHSEVGVVIFSGEATGYGPLSLDNDQNVQQVLSWIDNAGCQGGTPGLGTNLGRGLQTGLSLVDKNYDDLLPLMERHIILLTDGAWDDVATRSPQTLLESYTASYPGRAQPTIHGVFISDSLTHVEHGYPWQGCAGDGLVDLSHLQYSADATGGLYFPGSRPETVIENFQTLLDSVAQPVPRTLQGMVVTNLTNGETRSQKSIEVVPESVDDETHFQASIDNLPLEFGINTLIVKRMVLKPDAEVPETTASTVTIFRTKAWTTHINDAEYEEYCAKDSTTISITVTPPLRFVNQAFDVSSTIALKNKFILDTVQARVFTQNEDADDKVTIALFHFEEELKNSIGKATGTGTVNYSTSDALFGKFGISGGSFSVPVGTLNGDFAFETWIKPMSSNVQKDLFATSAFTLGISGDRHLFISIDGTEKATSSLALDASVWSHVAVARFQGNLYIFINGISASLPVAFNGNVSGVVTVSVPQDGALDEVRISSTHRMQPDDGGSLRFTVASLQNPGWNFGGALSSQPYLVIPPEAWNNGTLTFQFTSPIPGNMVVNFQHKGTTLETQWAKNGNPVDVSADLQGPFVDSSTFTRGDFGTEFDTLDVYFSEPVNCDSLKYDLDPAKSFQIFGPGMVLKDTVFKGAEYIDKSCPAEPWITSVRLLVKPSSDGIVPKRDSIKLVGITVDTAGNTPDLSKLGKIKFGPGSGLKLRAIPNPPSEPPMTLYIPDMQRLGIPLEEQNSKLLILQTREVLVPFSSTIDGKPNYAEKTTVYDAVGNIVISDVPIRQSQDDARLYYIVWNGLNKNKRRVSTGAYLFRATVMYENDLGRKIPVQTKFTLDWGRKKKF